MDFTLTLEHGRAVTLKDGNISVSMPVDAVGPFLHLWLDEPDPAPWPDTPVLLRYEVNRDGLPEWALAEDETPSLILQEDGTERWRRLASYVSALTEDVARGDATVVRPECLDRREWRLAAAALKHMTWGKGHAVAREEDAVVLTAQGIMDKVFRWAEQAARSKS